MSLEIIPKKISKRFQIDERRHASAILATDYPEEFHELLGCLAQFRLLRSEIAAPGGRKSNIAGRFDNYLYERGWGEKKTKIAMTIDGAERHVDTHSIDLCKNRVACEVQWNSKDGVFSRDLTTFRLLHEWDIISVGVVITRCDELDEIFDGLGWVKDKAGKPQRISDKYGQSTTHWSKLIGRIRGGDAGMCPMLLIGIGKGCYLDDIPDVPIVMARPSV